MIEGRTLRPIDFKVGTPVFLATIRLFLFAGHVVIFLSSHMLLTLLVRNEKRRLRLIVRSNAFHAGLVMKYLGLESFHEEANGKVRGKLITCNHLSYLDVLVLFTRYPSLFITSREIEETPVLGWITKLAGCFFVERRKERRTPEEAEKEMALMRKRLSEGFNIFLFPEGTSSDGKAVLPFKAHFFQLAIDSKSYLQPVVVKYHGANRDLAPWYGDMSFLPHFWKVCAEKNFSISIYQLPKISPAGKDKFQLKDEAYEQIRSAYERH